MLKKFGFDSSSTYERAKNITLKNHVVKLPENKGKRLLTDSQGRDPRFVAAKKTLKDSMRSSDAQRLKGDFKDDIWSDIIRDSQSKKPDRTFTLDLKASGFKEVPKKVNTTEARALVFKGPDGKKITYDNFESVLYGAEKFGTNGKLVDRAQKIAATKAKNAVYDGQRQKQFIRELRLLDPDDPNKTITLNNLVEKQAITRFKSLEKTDPEQYALFMKKKPNGDYEKSFNELLRNGFMRPDEVNKNFAITELDHPGKIGDLATILTTSIRNKDAANNALLNNAVIKEVYKRQPDLLEFSQIPWVRNNALNYLKDSNPEDFTFIGFLEDFAYSLRSCARTLGIKGMPFFPPVKNKAKGKISPLSVGQLQFLQEQNREEIQWYQRARSCFPSKS